MNPRREKQKTRIAKRPFQNRKHVYRDKIKSKFIWDLFCNIAAAKALTLFLLRVSSAEKVT